MITQIIKKITQIGLSAVLILCCAAYAAEENQKTIAETKPEIKQEIKPETKPETKPEIKTEVRTKTLTGEITGKSNNFLSLLYEVDEKNTTSREMAFSIHKKVRIEHKKDLSEIKVGDTVSVTYAETVEIEKDKSGKEKTKTLGRAVTVVTFIRPGPKMLIEPEMIPEKEIPAPAPKPPEEGEEDNEDEDNN